MAEWASIEAYHGISRRFKISEKISVINPFYFLRFIFPTISLDDLEEFKVITSGAIGPTGVGALDMITVPSGKMYQVHALRVSRTNGAAEEFNSFAFHDKSEGASCGFYFFTATGDTFYFLPHELRMAQQDILQVNVTTHNAGDELTMLAIVTEIEAYRLRTT